MLKARFTGTDVLSVESRAKLLLPRSHEPYCAVEDFGHRIALVVSTVIDGEQERIGLAWTADTGNSDRDAERNRFYASFGDHQRFLEWFADNGVAIIREHACLGLTPTDRARD